MPAPSVKSSSRIACGTRPSRMTAASTPPSTASRQVSTLGIMPPEIVPSAIRRRAVAGVNSGIRRLSASSTPGTSVSSRKPRRLDRGGDRARDRVGIDVVGLAGGADADRRDDRDDVGLLEGRRARRRRSAAGSPTKPRSTRLRRLELVRRFRAWISPPSLPVRPIAQPPAALIARDELLVDGPGEDHLDDFHRLAVGDPQPVDKAALDAEPVEHLVDLRPAAMHDDRMDADLLAAATTSRANESPPPRAHRMPAIFDDEGLAGIAAAYRAAPRPEPRP